MAFAVRPGHNQLVTAGRNLLLRLWDLETFTCLRTIKVRNALCLHTVAPLWIGTHRVIIVGLLIGIGDAGAVAGL